MDGLLLIHSTRHCIWTCNLHTYTGCTCVRMRVQEKYRLVHKAIVPYQFIVTLLIRTHWNEDTSINRAHFTVTNILFVTLKSGHLTNEDTSSLPRVSGLEWFHCISQKIWHMYTYIHNVPGYLAKEREYQVSLFRLHKQHTPVVWGRNLSLGVDVKFIQVPKHVGIVSKWVCVSCNSQVEQVRGGRAGGLQGMI